MPASRLRTVELTLLDQRQRLGLTGEIKWEKAGPGIVERHEKFIATFFDQIAARRVFLRVMFTHHARAPVVLTPEQMGDSYYLLCYQFLKHGLGLAHLPSHAKPPRRRIYLDEIGDTREQVAKFKGFVRGLPDTETIRAAGGLILEDSAIAEVRAHDHMIMQALDVVLGSVTFRLNHKHLAKLPGEHVRGKRTVTKERLYKFILGEIKRVTGKQGFNIGISTGLSEFPGGLWHDPYLHWCLTSRVHAFDPTAVKS